MTSFCYDCIGKNSGTATTKEFTTYHNPLVEQSPTANTAFHFPMEGHDGS